MKFAVCYTSRCLRTRVVWMQHLFHSTNTETAFHRLIGCMLSHKAMITVTANLMSCFDLYFMLVAFLLVV